MGKIVFGVFQDRDSASLAIDDLKDAGYNPKDVSILMKNAKEGETLAEDTGADVLSGAAGGATTGAIVGGLAGLVAAAALPGIGAFFIGGPIAASLGLTGGAAATVSGAATGAVAGGIIGVLGSMGLSRDEAKEYEQDIQNGGIFVAIPADAGGVSEVMDVLEDNGAQKIRFAQTKAIRADDFDEEEPRSSGYEETRVQGYHHPRYAVGSKGGKSDVDDARGWHGDSSGHKKAAKKRTTRSKKTR